ncbi:hypothetical protein BH10BAC2_BH10BAC2_15920 [soil metagenome]
MTKKLLYLLILLVCVYNTTAQSFQNEWIDYAKTYYKFKIGPFGYDAAGVPVKKGVVRISQLTLASIGLGNTPAEHLQLWRDGAEVPVYVSKSTGILSPSDYLEFLGEMANGKPDKALYSDTLSQPSDYWSLESDSAAYFLTVNPAGKNKRFEIAENNAAVATIAPEKNFIYTVGRYFRTEINQGYYINGEQKLYLSAYAKGEGFSSRPVRRNGSGFGQPELIQTFPGMYLDTTVATMTARFNLMGNAPGDRSVKIKLNNDSLVQFSMGYFAALKKVIPGLAANRIKNDTAYFVVQNLSASEGDDVRVVTIELEYPRKFNFGGNTDFEFYIEPSEAGRYLKITNFNRGNADAILYDITNEKRYTADKIIEDTLQFLLQPSQARYHLVLVRADGSAAKSVTTLQQRHFTNFNQQTNQGNYLIITNPALYGTGTENYIEQYSNYRSSDSGGHFNVRIVDIHDLEDQFAYGINMHPLAVKNFLRFARISFAAPPDYTFLIGKGITYTAYRYNETNPLTAQLNLIPVFGSPGSDNLLSSENYSDIPATPIGRLSAVSPEEVHVYLEKIKQYEAAQRDTINTIDSKLWMKKVIHLAGENDASMAYLVDSFQTKYSKIISDTLLGANVLTYSKKINPEGYAETLLDFTNEYNNGSALIEYLGHSSSTSIDFNLDNPANYNNQGKYPVFIVNGCLAGNIFEYDINRLNNRSTLAEKFILEPQRGAIGYLSSSNYAVLNYSNMFTRQFYLSMSSKEYGHGLGNIVKDGITKVINYTGPVDFYARMHAEQFTFNGDPALKLNSFPLPDFAIDSTQITVAPGRLTVASDSFTVKVRIHNLGRATNDSVHFYLVRQFTDGVSDTAVYTKLPAIKNTDSVSIKLPVVINRDKGITTITAIIDNDNLIPEISEKNNIASIKVNIYGAEPLPVYPYNYSIVNTNFVDLSASAPYDAETQYIVEVDTTALFNSSIKISRSQISKGGLIKFAGIPLSLNNTVYYWRVSEDSTEKHWNGFSFIYRQDSNAGSEQAHFFQHTQSLFSGMDLDSSSRDYKFSPTNSNLFIQHSIYPTSGNQDAQFSIALSGSTITWSACIGSSVIFNVFDPTTLKPILNSTLPYNAAYICDSMRRYNFEYSTQSATGRKNAMDFLDKYISDGYYVVLRKVYDLGNTDWAPTVWAGDTALYGRNNSLYHRLKEYGLAIDSFTYPRTFIFIFKKNDAANFTPVSYLSKGLYDRITTSQNISVFDTTALVTSPLFGPGKAWKKVTWDGKAENNTIASLDITTVDKNGKDSVWFTIGNTQHELDISSINAKDYPFIKLCMHTKDPVSIKPYQLQNWIVEYEPVAEGAIAANLGISIPASVNFDHDINTAFDTLNGYVVFKNVSSSSFDSLKLKLVLYDKNNGAHPFLLPKTRTLAADDTLHVAFLVNVTDLPEGIYNLYIEVNPDKDQPEQYHYNNALYQYIKINRSAKVLPVRLLDFTASPVNNNAKLEWTVTNEYNIADYQVEFSADGRLFANIGNVTATGTHTPEKKYSFLHIGTANGKNYYRLKMIDKDGRYGYSPVRNVIINKNEVLLYPNPFHDYINIVSNSSAKITAELSDITGKLVMKQTFSGTTVLLINNISPGIYIVRINDGLSVRSFKVYKQ